MQIYESVQDILKEFPQSNSAWMPLDTCFVADASDLGLRAGNPPTVDNIRDPWGRRFPCPPRPITDEDHDLVAWHFTTTVNKQEIECRVFND